MLKKHPRALGFIFFTEMWERVGFYTLMAILVLYMDKVLGWPDGRKGDIYGLFLALCYFVPLLGGWLGDKVIGQIRTVRAGAFLMALGYVGLGVSGPGHVSTFYIGLHLVGNLYSGRPELKDAGYNIFYMGVNLGAMAAPLVATVNNAVFHSYNLSFWVAAVGMVFALVIFRAGEHQLRPIDTKLGSGGRPGGPSSGAGEAAAPSASSASDDASCPALDTREERQRVATLVILFLIVIFFWIAFYQNFFGLTLFAERSTLVLKWLRPETYQFFEPFFILALTPVLLALFGRLNRAGKEPSTPVKILLGMLIMSLAMFVMVFASVAGANHDKNMMSPAWLIGTYFIVTLAEILISPMGQSFVSKVAPPNIAGLMMGGWFAATAAGSYGSGLLGKSYSRLAHHEFFLLLAGLMLLAAVLVALFLKKLRRFAT